MMNGTQRIEINPIPKLTVTVSVWFSREFNVVENEVDDD